MEDWVYGAFAKVEAVGVGSHGGNYGEGSNESVVKFGCWAGGFDVFSVEHDEHALLEE